MLALNASSIYVGTSLGAAIGGAVHDGLGTTWLGPASAVLALLALLSVVALRRGATAAEGGR
jgi:predicted MFS family arabinose efflux permease